MLVGLANDQSIMGDHSQEERALIKIQYEWADAPVKGDSSYTRRLEAEDLQSMTDIVFSEFKIQNLQARLYGDTAIVIGEGIINAHKEKQDLLGGKFVWTDTFVKHDGAWKVIASQITPVLEK